MNRRKANFKKLRLPSTENKNDPRNGTIKATTTISDFFSTETDNNTIEGEHKDKILECSESMPSPIESSSPMPSPKEEHDSNRRIRTKLKTFIPKEKRMKPLSDNSPSTFLRKTNDFESPLQSVKTAPKIKAKRNTKTKSKAKPKSKKQQDIKSAFFQNEELFSDVTAQHCLVDNINPDDMQMALALSRSEMEISGPNVESSDIGNNEGIREKLKKFGFQVSNSEVFNYTAAYRVTKGRNKWANKFTPLTLRNDKRQLEKVNKKVEEILKIQFDLYELNSQYEDVPKYFVQSSNLLPYVAKNCIIQSELSERTNTVDFYVLSLFEPSKTKPGHLLKDIRRIPGRDKSPINMKSSSKEQCILKENELELKSPDFKRVRVDEGSSSVESVLSQNVDTSSNVNQNLSQLSLPSTINESCGFKQTEQHNSPINTKFSSNIQCISKENQTEIKSPEFKRVRVDESSPSVESVLCQTLDTSLSGNQELSQLSLPSTINEPSDFKQRRRKTQNFMETDPFSPVDCQTETSSNLTNDTLKPSDTTSMHLVNSNNGNESNSSILSRAIRATSPDIFADSDVEMEKDDISEIELKCISSEDVIETYDIFSSDEAKTYLDSKVDSCDKNHNSLVLMIDLTQQESEISSENSEKLLPTPEFIPTYQDMNDLPSTLFGAQNNETLIRQRSLEKTDSSIENNALEKSSLIKRKKGLSFESNISDDFHKSISFNKSTDPEDSIDLTQDEELLDCIELSDDEVNYSMRKADISLHLKNENSSKENSFTSDAENKHEFSFVDLVAATQSLATQSEEFELSLSPRPKHSISSVEMDLSKRSEFGILDEQSPFKTPTKTPKKTPRKTHTKSPNSANNSSKKFRRALSESFLGSPTESSAPLKRFSSSNKFKEFTKSDEESFSDLDDIDKLIYGSPTKKVYKKPSGLTQLLTGPINDKVVTPEKENQEKPQEFEFNGKTYLVRTVDVSQRPNFSTMNESALFDKLYRYGIKPLKRKQAEKILEYIYNQTHPCLVDEDDMLPLTEKSDSDNELPSGDDEDRNENIASDTGSFKFNLRDCWGHVLVSDTVPSMEIKDEQYFFPTNKSKKISTAQLPLHIAWYNLLKANNNLHEAILYYEPIDLQEIYQFFKGIGYRYEPKEMKYFFDSRSIIFRYDIKKSEKSAGTRHTRKRR